MCERRGLSSFPSSYNVILSSYADDVQFNQMYLISYRKQVVRVIQCFLASSHGEFLMKRKVDKRFNTIPRLLLALLQIHIDWDPDLGTSDVPQQVKPFTFDKEKRSMRLFHLIFQLSGLNELRNPHDLIQILDEYEELPLLPECLTPLINVRFINVILRVNQAITVSDLLGDNSNLGFCETENDHVVLSRPSPMSQGILTLELPFDVDNSSAELSLMKNRFTNGISRVVDSLTLPHGDSINPLSLICGSFGIGTGRTTKYLIYLSSLQLDLNLTGVLCLGDTTGVMAASCLQLYKSANVLLLAATPSESESFQPRECDPLYYKDYTRFCMSPSLLGVGDWSDERFLELQQKTIKGKIPCCQLIMCDMSNLTDPTRIIVVIENSLLKNMLITFDEKGTIVIKMKTSVLKDYGYDIFGLLTRNFRYVSINVSLMHENWHNFVFVNCSGRYRISSYYSQILFKVDTMSKIMRFQDQLIPFQGSLLHAVQAVLGINLTYCILSLKKEFSFLPGSDLISQFQTISSSWVPYWSLDDKKLLLTNVISSLDGRVSHLKSSIRDIILIGRAGTKLALSSTLIASVQHQTRICLEALILLKMLSMFGQFNGIGSCLHHFKVNYNSMTLIRRNGLLQEILPEECVHDLVIEKDWGEKFYPTIKGQILKLLIKIYTNVHYVNQ